MSQQRCQEACFSGRGFGDCRRGLRANVLPRRAARMVSRPARRQRLAPMATASDNASFKSAGSIIGIDLGTSNSAVAVVKEGTPEILPLEAGRSTIPSVIWLGKGPEETLIGVPAQKAASSDPLNCFYSVKRLIGRPFANCYREAGTVVYDVKEGPAGETLLWSPARERAYTPEDISAMVLKHLVNAAAEHLGAEVSGAVIAVPAHFDERQRQATLNAAELAGLKQVQLLQEPVAAAMAYGLQTSNKEEEGILVFDLGGGTYDVSLLEGFEGIFEVIGTGGDSRLGGDDWDKALVEYCLQKCHPDISKQIRGQADLMLEIYKAARCAKIELSTKDETTIMVPNGYDQSKPVEVTLSRQEMELTTSWLRFKLGPPLERLGKECHIEWSGEIPSEELLQLGNGKSAEKDKFAPKPRKITQVVLVGSATRVPSVRQLVKKITGVEPATSVNPEECVALGAAIQAGLLVGNLKGMEMADGSFSEELHGRTTGFQGVKGVAPSMAVST